jgi:hypothetical protein
VTSSFLRDFPAANESLALENIEQSQRREFRGGFQKALSKLVSDFEEAIKNLIIVHGSESYRKTLKTISAYTGSTD